MTAPRLGIAHVPTLPPERLRAVALAADEHLDDLWVWEDCFKQSGLASATAALAWTERVRVGLGLMPAPLRSVALLAMEIATVQRTFPGRFVPGVGHGVQDWMGQAGVRVDSPMTLLEEVLTALRALLAGEEVTTSGRYVRLDRVRLDWPPAPGERLMSGGSGPRTLELAGRLTDGVLLAALLTEAEFVSQRASGLAGHATAAAAGDGGAEPEVVFTLLAATGPGAQDRLDADLRRWGHSPGDAVAGDAAAVADTVRHYGELGATTVVIQPTADDPDVEGLIRFVGEQVRPRLG